LPALCWFRLLAIAIIFCDLSIAVIRPRSSRSQTSETATPCPQPTSRMRSSGATASVLTAQNQPIGCVARHGEIMTGVHFLARRSS
jgi:hypothetical protein